MVSAGGFWLADELSIHDNGFIVESQREYGMMNVLTDGELAK